jgi:endonuclease/exonuclease/phosphatase family metal-dependent hydrolase
VNQRLLGLMSILYSGMPQIFAEAITAADAEYFYVMPMNIPQANGQVPVSAELPDPAEEFSFNFGTDAIPNLVKFSLIDGVYEIRGGHNYLYGHYGGFFDAGISDHAIAGKEVEGVPFYTWNTLGYETQSAWWSSGTKEPHFEDMRLNPMIEILKKIFENQPNAIIALQEFTQAGHNFRTKLLNALKPLGVNAEYLANTQGQSFGQMTLYNPKYYDITKGKSQNNTSSGVASVFQSRLPDKRQTGRAFKVILIEKTGKNRTFSVVNVHLKFYERSNPNRSGLFEAAMNELITYAEGKSTTVILGDFNYDMKYYNNPNSNVDVKPVGASLASVSMNSNTVDGIIVVKP